MKNKIKIVDIMFAHAKYSTDYQESEYIEWDRTPIKNDKIVFYTDYSLDQVRPPILMNMKDGIKFKSPGFGKYDPIVDNNQVNIAWLLESPDITSQSHKWIEYNNNKFDYVLTHNKELLNRGENFKFSATGGCWIKPEDQKIYDKSKLLSIIASAKRSTYGHLLRHECINKYRSKFDIYGREYNPVDYKLDALKDYAFSITIENTNRDYYFTEKLIDCFMTGTVPIYWGCPSIGDFFNVDGMIIFNSIDDLAKILDELSFDKYEQMKDAIEKNFEAAKEYLIAEDFIYKNYLER